ncbi:DUF6273 domain-containing protein [Anaerorhabdus furcosa]|uniref:DUF6273 domain-containing protein n=1 Tax=Anaerorhabdus furcosa TaxID=118967 RepID=A0A1T4Q2N7_9FIRM|nr:DUF6273 domain-containing protein [Anaerorhabdus furcosa]SJZ97797.1 hypothetical protein SAMN02745191_2272 [Anaerorhabdus furcosa]
MRVSVMNVGEKVSFGQYVWRILELQEDKALIITEDVIEERPYHNQYIDITWADCSLRNYLNTEFYHRFSNEEKMRIIPVINKNDDNHWYKTKGGVDTEDYIFLLSLEEATCKYFGDSSSKLFNPGKNQRYWFERKDMNNSKRLAKLIHTDWGWWYWLRTPGRVGVKAVYIFGTDGNIGIQGNNIFKGNLDEGRCRGGVRPALWLKLNKGDEE